MDVCYDPIGHRYLVNGVQWPSVTGALTRAGLIDGSWHTQLAARFGTKVHHATAAIERGLYETSDDPKLQGCADAYNRFRDTFAPEWHEIEQVSAHAQGKFCGRPDRVFRSLRSIASDVEGVLEIKTGSVARWHGYQTAGYRLLKGASLRYVLYLKPNGRYRLERCPDLTDEQTFLRALRDTWNTWQPT